jgi:hypothetical protein
LPGFLWRKLGRVGRALVVVLALAGLVAVILSIPGVQHAKRSNAERERLDQARASRERSARERELIRPRRVTAVRSTSALEQAITADVVRREHRRPLEVRCRRIPGAGRFSCLAVTSTAGSSRGNRGVEIGFPYRALVDISTGRGNICRALGRPGEGSLGKLTTTNPDACGG